MTLGSRRHHACLCLRKHKQPVGRSRAWGTSLGGRCKGTSPGAARPMSHPQAEFLTATSDFAKYGQDYDTERLREQVYETLQADKVMNWLIQNCQVRTAAA